MSLTNVTFAAQPEAETTNLAPATLEQITPNRFILNSQVRLPIDAAIAVHVQNETWLATVIGYCDAETGTAMVADVNYRLPNMSGGCQSAYPKPVVSSSQLAGSGSTGHPPAHRPRATWLLTHVWSNIWPVRSH